MADLSFYWHDYETSGVNPARDRPLQFAGMRTDFALNPMGDPLVLYCKPAMDILPSPEASLITGITPQKAAREGVIEAEFIRRIEQELATPGTCGVGYNSIRFDDEISRYTLYRNFYDPYAREWKNDCSRWDIIDLGRMTCALRPDGIEWPLDQDGKPSFRLELLTAANGISHEAAHDALSDVYATMELAKLLKDTQPRLFDWLLKLRSKHEVSALIDIRGGTPLVHTTRMYPSTQYCTSLVLPLCMESKNKSSVLVYDLRHDPDEFAGLDQQQLESRLFTRQDELPAGQNRLPVKSLKVNRSPAIAPAATLDSRAADRISIDLEHCARNREKLLAATGFAERIGKVFDSRSFEPSADVDGALYDGFISAADRKTADRVVHSAPGELAQDNYAFNDERLPELLFRYRARNWPETLNKQEKDQWREHCLACYEDPEQGLEAYFETIAGLREIHHQDSDKMGILDALEEWGDGLVGA